MSDDRQYQRNRQRLHPNDKENYPNDVEDQYTQSKPDVYGYNHWSPQGMMMFGYDQYGYHPLQMGSYRDGGLVTSFDSEHPTGPEISKSRHSGKKKIKLEYISGRNKRNVTFSKRKKGIMKKAYELNILTGTEVLLLVASESGHVYTFATPKLRPIINEHEGIIKRCLNGQEETNSEASQSLEENEKTSEESSG